MGGARGRSLFRGIALVLVLGPACADPAPDRHQDSVEVPAAEAPPDLSGMIADIRAGVRDLPALAGQDPVAARRRAVDLYVTRQEAIEQAWGPGGSRDPDAGLADSMVQAEAAFHRLLALLNRAERPDSSEVADAVAELEVRYDAVEEAAGAGRP